MCKAIHIFILLLLLGDVILGSIGIEPKYRWIFVCALSCISILCNRNVFLYKYKNLQTLLLFMPLLFVIKIKSGIESGSGAKLYSLLMFCTPFVFSSFSNFDPANQKIVKYWKTCLTILIWFYCLNCVIAIFEYIFNFQIINNMPFLDMKSSVYIYFRSTALLGHPLQNALFVSTLMSFFLISPFPERKKIKLWILGYIAIMCFNTRSSMVINLAIFAIYMGKRLLQSNTSRKTKLKYIRLGIGSTLLLSILFFHYGYGSRLSEMGLFQDSSSQARINAFKIFDYFPVKTFLFHGVNTDQYKMIEQTAGIAIIENFWIDFILIFGLIFTVILIILYWRLLKELYKGYSGFNVLLTLSTFLSVASVNNSLSTSWIPLFIYLLCIVLFNPLYWIAPYHLRISCKIVHRIDSRGLTT